MNRVLIFTLVLAATAAVFWRQKVSLAAGRAVARQWRTEAESAIDLVQKARQANAALETELGQELNRGKALREELAAWAALAEPAAAVPLALEAGQGWPPEERWCYLPKRDLTRFGFATFTRDGRLSDEAGLLFGMTRAERAKVEDAYATMVADLGALDLANMKPSTAPLSPHARPFANLRAQSFDVVISQEQAEAPRSQFEASVRDILTGNRGELFLQADERHRRLWFDELDSPPLRITAFSQPNASDGTYDVLLVEDGFKPAGNQMIGNGKYYYPKDDTAEGFQRYAGLVRAYLEAHGP